VIDTDAVAREVVEPPSPVLESIRAEFGSGVIAADGRLDREALGRIVFADVNKRRRLNEITHPEILKRVLARIGRYPPSALVVVVVPLLFESGFERNCQKVLAVVAPEQQRLARIISRDGLTEAEARARVRAQLAESEYEHRGDFVLRNVGDMASLERDVEAVWSALSQ